MRGICIKLFVLLGCCLAGSQVLAQKPTAQPKKLIIALTETRPVIKAGTNGFEVKNEKTALADGSGQSPKDKNEKEVAVSDLATASYCFPICQGGNDDSTPEAKESILINRPFDAIQRTIAAVDK